MSDKHVVVSIDKARTFLSKVWSLTDHLFLQFVGTPNPGHTLGIVLFFMFLFSCADQEPNIPSSTGLLTELLREPEKAVITDSLPEFSWVFPSEGKYQQAFRILVATSEELLEEGKADMWDSKQEYSAKSVDVSYEGESLTEQSTYFWKVKVWGLENTQSGYSESQQFNTGIFQNREQEWPGQSHFVSLAAGKDQWVSEDRQTATFHAIVPIVFKATASGSYFADFGKAAFGTLEFTAISQVEGAEIAIYLGERQNQDSATVNKMPGESNIGFEKLLVNLKEGTHDYRVDIPAHHSRSPHTQKLAPFYPEVLPYRFVEIIGDSGVFEIISVTQRALFYPFDEEASSFSTDNENLNQVLELCKYTLKATPFLGLYADGNRERMPYEADAYIQQLGHYAVDREFSIARYTNNFLLHHASWPTEWQTHTLFMAWEDYMNTGNTEFIRTYYDDLRAKTLMALRMEDGLISSKTDKVTPDFRASLHYDGNKFRDIVDWPQGTPEGEKQERNAGPTPEGERDGYQFVDYNTVVNAFYYQGLVCMSDMAKAVGKLEDAIIFENEAAKVKQAFQRAFFDAERGVFLDGEGATHASLHANMFSLAFGLVETEQLPTVINFIKSKGMACSVYGAQYLLDGLFDAGEAAYALSLMTSDGQRSWMNMIRVGSTMTTEAWDEYYKPNLTWNHAWGAAPVNVMVRKVLGIQATSPGYETFHIRPKPGELKKIQIKTPTVRGTIACNLEVQESGWEMMITIPGNSTATLSLPERFDSITIDGKAVGHTSAIDPNGESYNAIILEPGTAKINAYE
ncbi:MAG: alpha-L-rhamnosidase C-terminal domain-containing protein [Cyclobacteriaceae bacterium]